MLKLVIGNKNYSTWSLRPWLLLSGFDISFEEVPLSLRQEGLKARLGEYSDTAKVPVLLDGKLQVWDSLAICEYVSERYLSGQGWPFEVTKRALARAVVAEMHSGFSALRNEMPMNCKAARKVTPSEAAKADIARIDQIWSTYAEPDGAGHLRLFGRFGIADCFFAPVVMRFMTYGTALSTPARSYADSIRQIPALQKWVAAAYRETEVIPEDEAGTPI